MLKRVCNKKIIYGTAKIGNPHYGFSSTKKLDSKNYIDLIKKIINLGIVRFDTSPRYNDAEMLLGKAIKDLNNKPTIDTKVIGLIPNNFNSETIILNQVKSSLKRLNIDQINVLYLHQNELEIISDRNIKKALKKILKLGLVKKIGTSVYSLDELDYSLNSEIYETIQAPVNILNQSFYNHFKRFNKKKELIARSIYLQGTLLNTNFNNLKKLNLKLYESISDLYTLCKKNQTTVLNEAKSSVFELNNLHVIQSSLSLDNIKENLFYNPTKTKLILNKLQKSLDNGYGFTNPRNWNFQD